MRSFGGGTVRLLNAKRWNALEKTSRGTDLRTIFDANTDQPYKANVQINFMRLKASFVGDVCDTRRQEQ